MIAPRRRGDRRAPGKGWSVGRGAGGTFERSLGPVALLSFTLSALSPAASVFITGAGILRLAGTGAALAIALGALLAVLAAVQYAEVADAFPHAGGIYAGVDRLLGGWASFMILVLSVLASPAFLAFSALGLADYLGVLVPGLPRLPVAGGVIVGAAALALLRLRVSAGIAALFLALELLAVLALAAIAAPHPVRGPVAAALHPVFLSAAGISAPTPAWQMVLATVAGAWACSGALWGTYLGEDVRRDGASFGGTLALSGLIGALLVATPIFAVALAMRDPARTLASAAPLAAFMADRAGATFARGVSVAVCIAIFNNLMTMTMGLSRLLLATGRDGVWPAPLSALLTRTSARFGSPLAATMLLVLVSLPLVLVSERALLIVLSAELFSPLLIACAVLAGRRKLRGGTSYRSPLYPFLSLIGLGTVALFVVADWMDPSAGRPGLMLLATVVVAATILYFARGGARRRGPRSDTLPR